MGLTAQRPRPADAADDARYVPAAGMVRIPADAARRRPAVGAVGLLAGSAGAWLVAGVRLCAVLLANAAAVARRQRG